LGEKLAPRLDRLGGPVPWCPARATASIRAASKIRSGPMFPPARSVAALGRAMVVHSNGLFDHERALVEPGWARPVAREGPVDLFDLRQDARIERLLHQFWMMVVPDHDDDGASLSRHAYVTEWHPRVARAIFKGGSKSPAQMREMAVNDWHRDCLGQAALSRDQFFDAVFELAYLWTDMIDAEAFIHFLTVLRGRISSLSLYHQPKLRPIDLIDVPDIAPAVSEPDPLVPEQQRAHVQRQSRDGRRRRASGPVSPVRPRQEPGCHSRHVSTRPASIPPPSIHGCAPRCVADRESQVVPGAWLHRGRPAAVLVQNAVARDPAAQAHRREKRFVDRQLATLESELHELHLRERTTMLRIQENPIWHIELVNEATAADSDPTPAQRHGLLCIRYDAPDEGSSGSAAGRHRPYKHVFGKGHVQRTLADWARLCAI
ncbi:hypothetical protein PBRA_000534, partial [Plasmodiophora brassicae]